MAIDSVASIPVTQAPTTTKSPFASVLTKDNKDYLDALDIKEKDNKLKIGQDMGRDQFLHILMTQLANQNPLEPLQDKDFIAQMAQFSSLESMQSMNKNSESMSAELQAIKKLMEGSGTTGTQQAKDLAAMNAAIAKQTEVLTKQTSALDKINETLTDLKKLQIEQLNLLLNQAQAAAAYE